MKRAMTPDSDSENAKVEKKKCRLIAEKEEKQNEHKSIVFDHHSSVIGSSIKTGMIRSMERSNNIKTTSLVNPVNIKPSVKLLKKRDVVNKNNQDEDNMIDSMKGIQLNDTPITEYKKKETDNNNNKDASFLDQSSSSEDNNQVHIEIVKENHHQHDNNDDILDVYPIPQQYDSSHCSSPSSSRVEDSSSVNGDLSRRTSRSSITSRHEQEDVQDMEMDRQQSSSSSSSEEEYNDDNDEEEEESSSNTSNDDKDEDDASSSNEDDIKRVNGNNSILSDEDEDEDSVDNEGVYYFIYCLHCGERHR